MRNPALLKFHHRLLKVGHRLGVHRQVRPTATKLIIFMTLYSQAVVQIQIAGHPQTTASRKANQLINQKTVMREKGNQTRM